MGAAVSGGVSALEHEDEVGRGEEEHKGGDDVDVGAPELAPGGEGWRGVQWLARGGAASARCGAAGQTDGGAGGARCPDSEAPARSRAHPIRTSLMKAFAAFQWKRSWVV